MISQESNSNRRPSRMWTVILLSGTECLSLIPCCLPSTLLGGNPNIYLDTYTKTKHLYQAQDLVLLFICFLSHHPETTTGLVIASSLSLREAFFQPLAAFFWSTILDHGGWNLDGDCSNSVKIAFLLFGSLQGWTWNVAVTGAARKSPLKKGEDSFSRRFSQKVW